MNDITDVIGGAFWWLITIACIVFVVALIGAVAGYQPAKDFLSSGNPGGGCYSTSRFGACD